MASQTPPWDGLQIAHIPFLSACALCVGAVQGGEWSRALMIRSAIFFTLKHTVCAYDTPRGCVSNSDSDKYIDLSCVCEGLIVLFTQIEVTTLSFHCRHTDCFCSSWKTLGTLDSGQGDLLVEIFTSVITL
ncbi:hypothetical protein R3P38DRAFT_795045 [Favolaschia claudopus]|uniref:Secreted protein n=1 Tax=Favolaschia claudopus TaxID=2862362 RepID=A0AAW0C3U3_9AGAR